MTSIGYKSDSEPAVETPYLASRVSYAVYFFKYFADKLLEHKKRLPQWQRSIVPFR